MPYAFPAEFLSRLVSGSVIATGVVSPAAALAEIEDYAEEQMAGTRVVGLHLACLSSHDHLLGRCVGNIAEAAMALWPDWYGANVGLGKKGIQPPAVSGLWLKRAAVLASAGNVPLPRGYPSAFNVTQLGMALGCPDLIIALVVSDKAPPKAKLDSVIATARWLAEQTQARVALLVERSVLAADEFDRVARESLAFEVTSLPPQKLEEIPAVTITAVKGRPNPTSPGEVLLADRLGKSSVLAGLFGFNQTIRSVHDKEYKVDLLWPEGRLVVEVDGYTFHSSSFAFSQDRHRDYELMISGYRVLRLTHEEIMKDTIRAIAKIGDLVQFIKKNQLHVV